MNLFLNVVQIENNYKKYLFQICVYLMYINATYYCEDAPNNVTGKLFYIRDFGSHIPQEIFLSNVARIFEKTFNANFGDIYKKEVAVIKLKSPKVIKILDRIKAAIIQKAKTRTISVNKKIL